MLHSATRRLQLFFGSPTFFYIILGFFIFEALWFVFSAVYPMPFDEEFHFGLIKLYSHHWLPFLASQPSGADGFGAVARDPSYLYHYVLSFPYRLITWATSNETTQVILLRLMNVSLFTYGLWLFRKLLLRVGSSLALTHVALAIFVLIPVVPQLAAHINYDNGFMVLVPLLCLQVVNIIQGLQKRRIDVQMILLAIITSFAMSLIKYAALPMVLACALFVAVSAARHFRGRYANIGKELVRGYRGIRLSTKVLLLGAIFIGVVLFSQRYVINLVQYKTPVPDCGAVLSVKQCSAYGPWNRDYQYAQNKTADFRPDPVHFMDGWPQGMWHRLFFAINGVRAHYMNYRELPVPSQTATILAIVGLFALVLYFRPVFRGQELLAFLLTFVLVYVAVLWADGYEAYQRTGHIVAINGRYLLPVLLPLAAIMGRALSLAWKKNPTMKVWLATFVIALFLHGGGIFTFILRSDSTWYWPNQTVNHVNNAARKVLAPVIIEGHNK